MLHLECVDIKLQLIGRLVMNRLAIIAVTGALALVLTACDTKDEDKEKLPPRPLKLKPCQWKNLKWTELGLAKKQPTRPLPPKPSLKRNPNKLKIDQIIKTPLNSMGFFIYGVWYEGSD